MAIMLVSFFHKIARVTSCHAVFEGRIPILKENKISGAVPEKRKNLRVLSELEVFCMEPPALGGGAFSMALAS